MSPELPIKTNREIQREMYDLIHEVHGEVMGNPKADRPSYGQRLNKLETSHKNQGKIYLLISSISSGITLAIHMLFKNS